MSDEKDIDLAVEETMAEEHRKYVSFAKLIISDLPRSVRSEINKEFSVAELEHFADCKTTLLFGMTKRRLKRAVEYELRYLLEDGWAACRVALAFSEFLLTVQSLLSCHSKRGGEDAVGLLNNYGLNFSRNPRPEGGISYVPVKYFINKIMNRACVSDFTAEFIWKKIINALINDIIDFTGFDIAVKYRSLQTVEIKNLNSNISEMEE